MTFGRLRFSVPDRLASGRTFTEPKLCPECNYPAFGSWQVHAPLDETCWVYLARADMLDDRWLPVDDVERLFIDQHGLPVIFEASTTVRKPSFAATLAEYNPGLNAGWWTHDWLAILVASGRSSCRQRVNHRKLHEPVLRAAKDPEAQRALVSMARLGGIDAVASWAGFKAHAAAEWRVQQLLHWRGR